MTVTELDAFLRAELPHAFRYDAFSIERADGRTCRIRQGFHESMLRPGARVSGATLMTLADGAMYVLLLSAIGPVALAVTTNLNINFLRKPAPRDLLADAHLLKLGKRLAIGEVLIRSEGDADLVAHATSTYSIPPQSGV